MKKMKCLDCEETFEANTPESKEAWMEKFHKIWNETKEY